MSESTPRHADRDRALVFGGQADAYERYRPDFPADLMDAVAALGHRVLDVGSGTGKAAAALRERGCEVLAVEPDPKMAEIARDKGISVESASFEEWDPQGRTFDLVTFARSWHWVDPAIGIEKLTRIVPAGGHVALLAHESTWRAFEGRPAVRAALGDLVLEDRPTRKRLTDETTALFTAAGFEVRLEEFPMSEVVTAAAWLDSVFTYSKFLQLDPATAATLRSDLAEAIGPGPVDVSGTPRVMIARRL